MHGILMENKDIEQIIAAVKSRYGFDFSNFAITSFKHRVGESLRLHNIFSIEEFTTRLISEETFFEIFLKEASVTETEAFRDSGIWRILRFEILKNLFEKHLEKIRIWIPGCTTGDELFTLAIILQESCLSEKVEVLASSMSMRCIEQIKTGLFNPKKVDTNIANYQRYMGKNDFQTYYSHSAIKTQWDTKLLKDIKFLKPLSLFKDPPKGIHIILFRNRMLFYNNLMQQKIFETLSQSLSAEGYLILGAKETILNFPIKHKFTVVNELESIYKKNR